MAFPPLQQVTGSLGSESRKYICPFIFMSITFPVHVITLEKWTKELKWPTQVLEVTLWVSSHETISSSVNQVDGEYQSPGRRDSHNHSNEEGPGLGHPHSSPWRWCTAWCRGPIRGQKVNDKRMALDPTQTWVQTPAQALSTWVAISNFGFFIFKMDLILHVSDDWHSFKNRYGCYDMKEKNDTKWKKAVTKSHMLYNSIHMKCPGQTCTWRQRGD